MIGVVLLALLAPQDTVQADNNVDVPSWQSLLEPLSGWFDASSSNTLNNTKVLFAPEHLEPFAVLEAMPVTTEVSSTFGYRRDPFRRKRRMHKGIDFRGKRGTPVYAAGTGVVIRSGWWGGYGRVVVIAHGDGIETRYAHLRRTNVAVGEIVSISSQIGRIGSSGRSTGPHLHFEVRHNGKAVDPQEAFQKAYEARLSPLRQLFFAFYPDVESPAGFFTKRALLDHPS